MENCKPTEHKRAIAFDGGGIRGLFQAAFMTRLANLNLLEQSHLLAGTSTGAIIAVCLALGKHPADILELYCSLGQKVFQNKKNRLSQAFLKQPAYSAETLKKLLQEQIPYNIKFGDCKKRVLVAATSLNTCSCQVFDSTHPHHRAIGAVDILLASSAAPTYFPPHSIPTPILEPETAPKHPTKTIWADGGLTCNNPAFECVATLLKDGSQYERWPSMLPTDKRKIVEALIEKIVIGDGEIDITFSHLPSSEEQCKNQQGLGLG